jgi:hypothetical protein
VRLHDGRGRGHSNSVGVVDFLSVGIGEPDHIARLSHFYATVRPDAPRMARCSVPQGFSMTRDVAHRASG